MTAASTIDVQNEDLRDTPAPLADGRIAELDGVRGVAIALVLVYHYFVMLVTPESPHWLRPLRVCGLWTWSGVDLFFVLSAFLIGGILIDHRDSPNSLCVFYTRRSLRIFPLYFAWLAAYL